MADLFSANARRKVEIELTKKCDEKDQYIHQLEEILQKHEIEVPNHHQSVVKKTLAERGFLLRGGSLHEIESLISAQREHLRTNEIVVEYHDLNFSVKVSGKTNEVFILKNVSGRILPRKMTLLIGPPGSGKSVLLKALAGRLHAPNATISGEVYYDGDNIHSNKFQVRSVADYIEQGDTHEPLLTVAETFKFAWDCTTGGSPSYGLAKDEKSAAILDRDTAPNSAVHNILTILGLTECKDTYVGDNMIRGVSGGQKRRVTIGEMLLTPRPIRFMDCISNGLDTATTYDIIRALASSNSSLGTTTLISLLQPPPDVYDLFDEIILLCEGYVIYHGPKDLILPYFEALGYRCPDHLDEADFLQELPTPEGKRFLKASNNNNSDNHHRHTPIALANAWQSSELNRKLFIEMKYSSLEIAQIKEKENNKIWYPEQNRIFARDDFWYYFKLNLSRQMTMISRDMSFIMARIGQALIIGAINGSLFNNIKTKDVSTMNGFIFNVLLFAGLGAFSLLPLVYSQKAVYSKMKDASFYPTVSFTLAQNISLYPLFLLESIFLVLITYWSAGLSSEHNGSRFFTFILIAFVTNLNIGQSLRAVAAIVPSMGAAMPLSGMVIIIMVLFSGFIQPKKIIPPGWVWFYYLNPIAWAFKSVTINEFMSSKYDFLTCTDPSCTHEKRYGDVVLEQYGIETDENYIWYSIAVIVAEYFFFFLLTTLAMKYIRIEVPPAPPTRTDEEEEFHKNNSSSSSSLVVALNGKDYKEIPIIPVPVIKKEEKSLEALEAGESQEEEDVETIQDNAGTPRIQQLPFEPVSFAFREIWYTVTVNKEPLDLIQNVNGFFEPGTITCLMGSSGAGKTTLLDVLSGRKNTGVVKGEIFLNGLPKVDAYFQKIMGYVEQFDSLPPKSTAREAIAFSASLRLSPKISKADREMWVDSVLKMMDLESLQDRLIGELGAGGMSFEQRKRVSIGVELAANPSILFLDEPTTGLDSLAAQALVRNLRTVASTGRSIVCTIHQPSALIFHSFDSLLLLKRGGQTVFFGPLGEEGQNLIHFFESTPGVDPMPKHINPATWMLDVIGAGVANHSSSSSATTTNNTEEKQDFHDFYQHSSLSMTNQQHLAILCEPNEYSRKLNEDDIQDHGYNATYLQQYFLLLKRIALLYYRTPTYSVARIISNIVIALIFGSAYPQQSYDTYVGVISRSAVIFITSLFCAVLAMLQITPVLIPERAVFYREQSSRMYSVFIYCLTLVTIEIPCLIISALAFTLPFFYIVGFNKNGNETERFLWYWLFNTLLQGAMLFLAEFYIALAPDEATTQVFGGFTNTILGTFCGFLIAEQHFPTFWLFLYWMNPMHYALEGLITSQFHQDTTKIQLMNGEWTTAEDYISNVQFTRWKYDHVGYDILGLGVIMAFAVIGNYLCLSYLRHNKR